MPITEIRSRKPIRGVTTWISDRSEFTPKTILTKNERANLVYAVKIAVKNDGELKIGMYGGVKLKVGNWENGESRLKVADGRRTHSGCAKKSAKAMERWKR